MDVSPSGMVRSIVPQLHVILATFILALFGYSRNAREQDILTEIFVAFIRPVLGRPISLLKSQSQFGKDWAILGPMWISKYTIPKPLDNPQQDERKLTVTQALSAAMLALKDVDGNTVDYAMPQVVDVETEWTSYRHGVSMFASRPKISEAEQYRLMMKEVEQDSPTVLYFHGGAFCLMDPAQLRSTVSSLSKRTKGRYLSVRYRLSPQNVFPSALMDAFIAYLSLICPPPNAFHQPVPPSRIVISGDSSGGGLAASLLLLLLTLPRLGITHIHFHGHDVPIASPPVAGLAVNSPWLDISRALPSVHRNAQFDIIAPPSIEPYLGGGTPDFPHDSIWPTSPPRVETYCNADQVLHPLVSPLTARKEFWTGSPPVFACIGWEFCQDETEVTLRRMYEAGAAVCFEGYVGMPHCFSSTLCNNAAVTAFDSMATFCKDAVSGAIKRKSEGKWMDKSGHVQYVKLSKLGITRGHWEPEDKMPLDDATVGRLLAKSKHWRVDLENEMLVEWRRNCDFRKNS